MKFTNTIIVTLAITFMGTLGIVSYTSLNGGDVDNLIYLIIALLGAAFPGLMNGKELTKVKNNTNGTLSALIEQNRKVEEENRILAARLAQSTGEIPKEII